MVVPAYRHLSDDEKISMRQCVDVLGGHDIIVIHPERLDLTEDLQSWQSVVVKALCNEWFDGVKGYNSMLLSRPVKKTGYIARIIGQSGGCASSGHVLQ